MTYLFIDSVIKSCDSPNWLVHTCYPSAASRVTETKFLTQKCFSVENCIIVSLNTVIPIIVLFSYQRLLDVSINGLFIAIQCLLHFNVVFRVMHTAYWHKCDFLVVMCLSRQVDSLVSRLRKTMSVLHYSIRFVIAVFAYNTSNCWVQIYTWRGTKSSILNCKLLNCKPVQEHSYRWLAIPNI